MAVSQQLGVTQRSQVSKRPPLLQWIQRSHWALAMIALPLLASWGSAQSSSEDLGLRNRHRLEGTIYYLLDPRIAIADSIVFGALPKPPGMEQPKSPDSEAPTKSVEPQDDNQLESSDDSNPLGNDNDSEPSGDESVAADSPPDAGSTQGQPSEEAADPAPSDPQPSSAESETEAESDQNSEEEDSVSEATGVDTDGPGTSAVTSEPTDPSGRAMEMATEVEIDPESLRPLASLEIFAGDYLSQKAETDIRLTFTEFFYTACENAEEAKTLTGFTNKIEKLANQGTLLTISLQFRVTGPVGAEQIYSELLLRGFRVQSKKLGNLYRPNRFELIFEDSAVSLLPVG